MQSLSKIEIDVPAVPEIVQALAPIVTMARAFDVSDQETNGEALERMKRLRLGRKAIEEHFAKAIKDAHAAHKSILSSVSALTGPIQEAERIYDTKADLYEREERRKAEEQQRILQEQARKQEEERQLMAAIEAEEAGDQQQAEAIFNEPVEAPAVIVAPPVATVAGVSRRTLWYAEVDDVKKCLRFLLDRPEWETTLQKCIPILETAFRPLAVAQQKALAIPGVRAVETTSRGVRR